VQEDQLISRNYLGDNPDKPIYRIMPVKYLVTDVAKQILTMPRVIGWEDTYEAAYFRRTIPGSKVGERVGLAGLAKDWFGLCWSGVRESDAMWRIYNRNGMSVRIETTPRKLMASIFHSRLLRYRGFSGYARISLYMGDVSYQGEMGFRTLMSTPVSQVLDDAGRGMAQMLCVKREPFQHEGEVRLLYNAHLSAPNSMEPNGDAGLLSNASPAPYMINGSDVMLAPLIHLPFDWSCITSVMIGPLVKERTAKIVRNKVMCALPGLRESISVSDLYGKPNYPGFL
jgi:hypothetical protein